MEYATLIMKPTNACNAACVYCSAWKEHYPRLTMSRQTLRLLHQRLAAQAERGLRGVMFTWHGGEPLLMPASFYELVLELQEELLRPAGLEVNNIMQSNLLAYNPDIAGLLKRLLRLDDGTPGPIGTSFDPIGGIRLMKQGDYDRRFRASVGLARQEGQPLGLVYTVHRYSLDRAAEVFACLAGEFVDIPVRMNPMYPEGRAGRPGSEHYHLTPEQWGRFMVEMYGLWLDSGTQQRWDPFSALHEYHHQGITNNLCCEESGNCASSHLGVDADGTIYTCGRGVDRGTQPLGNILQQDLAAILDSPVRLRCANRIIYLQLSACRGCGWWRYCHGGCYVDPEITYGDPFRPTTWCQARKYFFEQVFGAPRADQEPEPLPEICYGRGRAAEYALSPAGCLV
ncbi:MAG: radical SAM protein [Desulfarculus sp.]|jgi:uncharacterized protein|nr:MAG: radical SAM protein [Desulfarculus sp.]